MLFADIDLIFKIFQKFETVLLAFPVPIYSKIYDFPISGNLRFPRTRLLENDVDFSWNRGILASQKMNHIGVGAQGHVQKSRNHRNEGFEVSPITKSKSY